MPRLIAALLMASVIVLIGASPSPVGAVPQMVLSVDCNPASVSIQATCDVLPNTPAFDVALVLKNETGAPVSLGAFAFEVHDPDTTRLNPPAISNGAPYLNDNPNFNEADVTGAPWVCGPPVPDNDTGEDGPGTAVSYLNCFNSVETGPTINHGQSIVIATVRYSVPNGAPGGSVALSVADANVADNVYDELGSCAPVITVAMVCYDATITVTPFTLVADCDMVKAGVQSLCYVRNDPGTQRMVVFALENNSGAPANVGSFTFPSLYAGERLNALPINNGAPYLNDNPDYSMPVTAGWSCGPPAPVANTGTGPPGSSISSIDCSTTGSPQPIPNNARIPVATVQYNIMSYAAPGPVPIGISGSVIRDLASTELGSCNPTVAVDMRCIGATVVLYCAIAKADVSGNGTVNAQDLGQVAQHFGELPAPFQYEQDFNGVINAADLGLVAQRFFQTVAMCP